MDIILDCSYSKNMASANYANNDDSSFSLSGLLSSSVLITLAKVVKYTFPSVLVLR